MEETKTKRIRRSAEEVRTDKLAKIETKIEALKKQISDLEKEKEDLQNPPKKTLNINMSSKKMEDIIRSEYGTEAFIEAITSTKDITEEKERRTALKAFYESKSDE